MHERKLLARRVQAKSNALARAERAAYRHDNQNKVSAAKLEKARQAYRDAWDELHAYDKEHGDE